MRDIRLVSKSILLTEFELVNDIWEQLQREGCDPVRAAAAIYKHGYLDGRSDMKERKNEAYRKLDIAQNALIANNIPIPKYSINKEQENKENE